MGDRHYIAHIELDEKSVIRRSPQVEHERKVAPGTDRVVDLVVRIDPHVGAQDRIDDLAARDDRAAADDGVGHHARQALLLLETVHRLGRRDRGLPGADGPFPVVEVELRTARDQVHAALRSPLAVRPEPVCRFAADRLRHP